MRYLIILCLTIFSVASSNGMEKGNFHKKENVWLPGKENLEFDHYLKTNILHLDSTELYNLIKLTRNKMDE